MREDIDKVKKLQIIELMNGQKALILETRLSRIWKFVEDGMPFGMISPFRSYYDAKTNNERFDELVKIVREDLKLGYIEVEGGFKEQGIWVKERTLFIPKIDKKTLMKLGTKYEQFSVIYKDDNEFVEVGTNDAAGIGNIIRTFRQKIWDKNFEINTERTKELFTRLIKGKDKDKKFLFADIKPNSQVSESYLYELDSPTFNDYYRLSKGEIGRRVIKLI